MTDTQFNNHRLDTLRKPHNKESNDNEINVLTVSIGGYEARFNELFPHLDVATRITRALWDFPESTVVTTSGGIQSGFLLAQLANLKKSSDELVRSAISRLPIIFLDTGDLFPETIQYVAELKRSLDLNIIRYRHGLSDEELAENTATLERTGLTRQSAFDELTKVRPMKTILTRHQAKVWIAGNRRDQSPSRANLPYAVVQNSYLKIFPMADIEGREIKGALSTLGIPPHPLSNTYRSVGNVSDTQQVEGAFEKIGRHSGLKQECGLHEGWVSRGKTLRKIDGLFIPTEEMPVHVVSL